MSIYEGFGYETSRGTSVFMIFFYVILALIIGVILFTAIRALYIWNKNNHSPRQTVHAEVFTKRQDFSTFRHNANNGIGHYNTMYVKYFVLFQLDNGEKIRLKVKPGEYDLLRERDKGMLTYQGTRYLGFEAQAEDPYFS